MVKFILLLIVCLISTQAYSQNGDYPYDPSDQHPFGQLNPEAPEQVAEYKYLIGESRCKSVSRLAGGNWSKDSVDMIWRFKYFLNGTSVIDETLKADGKHSSSIRQYNPDSAQWYVTYFSTAASPSPGIWSGGVKDNKIVLYRPQKAPNGTDGFYKITFSDIARTGFNWKGEWVDPTEQVKFPTWLIYCRKEIE